MPLPSHLPLSLPHSLPLLLPTRSPNIPSGKQSPLYHSFSAVYTRTTGIWQSVWLEACGENRIDGVRFDTRINGDVTAALAFHKSAVGCTVELDVSFAGRPVARISETVTAFDWQKVFGKDYNS